MGIVLLLAPLAIAGWIGWHHGWPAGAWAIAAVLVAYTAGFQGLRVALVSEGYVVDMRPDGLGRKRWRVGLRPPKAPEADAAEWIAPRR